MFTCGSFVRQDHNFQLLKIQLLVLLFRQEFTQLFDSHCGSRIPFGVSEKFQWKIYKNEGKHEAFQLTF